MKTNIHQDTNSLISIEPSHNNTQENALSGIDVMYICFVLEPRVRKGR